MENICPQCGSTHWNSGGATGRHCARCDADLLPPVDNGGITKRNIGKMEIEWTCPLCRHRHEWQWEDTLLYDDSVWMVCDNCFNESHMTFIAWDDWVWDGDWRKHEDPYPLCQATDCLPVNRTIPYVVSEPGSVKALLNMKRPVMRGAFSGGKEMNKGLAYIGEGIAFAALCFSASWLEIHDKPAMGIWILIVIWAFCFGPKDWKE